MKIHYAINSCDNSFYKDYWPAISKAWNKLGICPVLVSIGGIKEINHRPDKVLINLPEIPGIKTSFQAQIARIWAFKMLGGEYNSIISDIDMMPINSNYFNGTAKNFNEDQIVSYCSDAKDKFDGTEPMCYILSNNKVMSSLITYADWETFVRHIAYLTGEGWSADQWYITDLLSKYENTVRLNRGWNEAGCANNRLDRLDWRFYDADVKEGRIYDAHLLRPYEPNAVEINRLLNIIP